MECLIHLGFRNFWCKVDCMANQWVHNKGRCGPFKTYSFVPKEGDHNNCNHPFDVEVARGSFDWGDHVDFESWDIYHRCSFSGTTGETSMEKRELEGIE